MDNNEFVTYKEACELLNRTPKMIDIYVEKGLLTRHKQLGNTFFPRSEIENLLIPQPVKTA